MRNCTSLSCVNAFTNIESVMDPSIDPCDDFYKKKILFLIDVKVGQL